MSRYILIVILATTLSACVTSAPGPKLDGGQESIRAAIARLALRTPAFGSISIIKAKIIDAKISAPEQRRMLFTGEPYTYHCVQAFIENPMFPVHQPAYAQVEITNRDGHPSIKIRSSTLTQCSGAGFEPFPEIEEQSVRRYQS